MRKIPHTKNLSSDHVYVYVHVHVNDHDNVNVYDHELSLRTSGFHHLVSIDT